MGVWLEGAFFELRFLELAVGSTPTAVFFLNLLTTSPPIPPPSEKCCAVLFIRVLAHQYFCIVHLRLEMKSTAPNYMPEVVSDLLAPQTSGPRDVPRCGALSLLQKMPHYRGGPSRNRC